jgi:hypothetical protein
MMRYGVPKSDDVRKSRLIAMGRYVIPLNRYSHFSSKVPTVRNKGESVKASRGTYGGIIDISSDL